MKGQQVTHDDLTQSLADLHVAFLMHKLMYEHCHELDEFHGSVVDEYQSTVMSYMEQYLREVKFENSRLSDSVSAIVHGNVDDGLNWKITEVTPQKIYPDPNFKV